jgi:CTP:molybdopterin cytidylyltransferase MocA
MTLPQVRWLTFFTRPANKGKELMLEYNERAAVSRIIIPALIEAWGTTDRQRYVAWNAAVESARAGSITALDEIEHWLRLLPETVTPAELEERHPGAYGECKLAFPVLLQERRHSPIKVRSRALHHLGEIRRVSTAARELHSAGWSASAGPEGDTGVLRCLGALLSQSHASLRDLYEVSTPDVERLVDLVTTDPHVYGARLMGGGFGGNVLALTTAEHAAEVVTRTQSLFYEPEQRQAEKEGSVMVSTPGDGLSALDFETATRTTLEFFNANWRESERFREPICRMLDQLIPDPSSPEIWPVIVAAGRGRRAKESGIPVPKPLASVAGTPALKWVLEAVQTEQLRVRPPVIIVSPSTEAAVRDLLQDHEVIYVTQPRALGTGDAVLCACEHMRNYRGRTLVVWGTQPVLRPETVRRTVRLAAIFPDYDMVVPTTLISHPYAPLLRDEQGNVRASRETYLEQAKGSAFGETNIGLFVAWNEVLFRILSELRQALWQESERCYRRPGGELGFPNELITYLSERPGGVLASPIADFREEKGIKSHQDLAVCERYLRELGASPRR